MGEGRDQAGQGRDDDERGEHHAQGGDNAAGDPALLLTDKGSRVNGDDAGRTLANGIIVAQLILGGPVLFLHDLPLQNGQHGHASAEGHYADLREGQE